MSGRVRRVWHPDVPGPGARLDLDPDESHHVLRVLRLQAGDLLRVFDGRGGEWSARLEAASGGLAVVRVGEAIVDVVEPGRRVVLVQGLCRPERIEWVLQKGTEIGVSSFRLVPCERSEGPPPSEGRRERWRRIVLEACKQSGRRWVPDLALEEHPALPSAGTAAFVLDPGPDALPLGGHRVEAGDEIRLAVGPEGGLTDGEIERLAAEGWRRAGLGPRVLRTETAAVVACALALHLWGDLGSVDGAS